MTGLRGKSVHFPGRKRDGCGQEGSLVGMCILERGESDGTSWKIGSLSRMEGEEDVVGRVFCI